MDDITFSPSLEYLKEIGPKDYDFFKLSFPYRQKIKVYIMIA